MTPNEYFSDYDDEEEESEGISPDIEKRTWTMHKHIFKYILRFCPFPLTYDQYNWIVESLDDI